MSRPPNHTTPALLATARWLQSFEKLSARTMRQCYRHAATDLIAAACRMVKAEARQRREEARAHGIVVEPVEARAGARKRRATDTPPQQAHRMHASTMHPRRAAMDVGVRRALDPTRRIDTHQHSPRAAVVAALKAQSERREHDRRLDAVAAALPTLSDRLSALEQHVAARATTAPMVVAPPTPPAAPTVTTLTRVLRDGIRAVVATMRRAWHRCFQRVLG